MTTTRREQLREIMSSAWSWFRQVGGTFADALRTAWRAHRVRHTPRPVLHRVKPFSRPTMSPLTAGPTLIARAERRKAAWYGAKVANW